MDKVSIEYSKYPFVSLGKGQREKIDLSVLENETPLLSLLAKYERKNCSHVQGNVYCNHKSNL